MQHFNKNIAYFSMEDAIHNFSYPSSLKDIDETKIVSMETLFPYENSESYQRFFELRKQIIKMPLYVLETKPNLVKKYLMATERFYKYLKKVQTRSGIKNNMLVNNLFLVDTIMDTTNNKIIFTNYSIIALLMKYIARQETDKNKESVVNFLDNKETMDFVFFDDDQKYKLTKIYSDKYIFGIGVKIDS